jgi:hypothetical protein
VFSELLDCFLTLMEWVEWALDVQMIVRTFAFVQMLEKRVFWQVVVWVVRTLEHFLALYDL